MRETLYHDDRYTIIYGRDHAIGEFYQIYDKSMVNRTPEGEGIIFEWSEKFGIETNRTTIDHKSPNNPIKFIAKFINDYIIN